MVSPELLRRYPFFGGLNDAQLKAVAMTAEQVEISLGDEMFIEGAPADTFYLLLNGSVDLYTRSEEEYRPQSRKEFSAGEINPGEVFGLSALVGGGYFTATARAAKHCQILTLAADELRRLMEADYQLGYVLMRQAAHAALSRMNGLRAQLAAAWAE